MSKRGRIDLWEEIEKDLHGRFMKQFFKREQRIPDYFLPHLSPRERAVIEMHLFQRKSFKEIGQLFSRHGETVRQVERKALIKLYPIWKG